MIINQKGFSLIELIAVIAIVGIASTIVIAQYSDSRDSKALFLGAKQIANDVRMAQNYAFGALESGGVNPGYGIRFSNNSSSYIIFADKDNDKIYDVADSEEFQTVSLPEGITVQSLKVDNVEAVDGNVDVVFTSPYGEVFIDENNGSSIILKVKIGNSTDAEIIDISGSGKIN